MREWGNGEWGMANGKIYGETYGETYLSLDYAEVLVITPIQT